MPPPSPGICSALAVMKCVDATQNAHSLPSAIHCRNGHIRTIECISSLRLRSRSRHSSQAADVDPNESRAAIHMLEVVRHGQHGFSATDNTDNTEGLFVGQGDDERHVGSHRWANTLVRPPGAQMPYPCCPCCPWLVLSVARVIRGSCIRGSCYPRPVLIRGTIWRTCAHTLSALRPS